MLIVSEVTKSFFVLVGIFEIFRKGTDLQGTSRLDTLKWTTEYSSILSTSFF